jgi:hypothetical protein
VDDLHEQTVASLERVVVHMPGIGQMLAGRLLARWGLRVAGQAR